MKKKQLPDNHPRAKLNSSNDKGKPKKVSENRESRLLVRHSFEMARELGISTILVYAESVQDQRYILKSKKHEKIIFLSQRTQDIHEDFRDSCDILTLPHHDLSRSEQFQLGLLIATLSDKVEIDETVLCMAGLVGSLRLDNLLITNLQRDNKWFKQHNYESIPKDLLLSKQFIKLLDIVLRLAKEGREGKNIGTMFVLGNPHSFSEHYEQMILNPFAGHPEEFRNMHNEDFFETIREFAALDGAFVVNNEGTFERAGVYIRPPTSNNIKRPRGLGARHTSAAAFTSSIDALVITLSESSSIVTVFSKGSAVLTLNP